LANDRDFRVERRGQVVGKLEVASGVGNMEEARI
jgi:hypothetical protein